MSPFSTPCICPDAFHVHRLVPPQSSPRGIEQLERLILVLLVVIGLFLIIEGFLPQEIPGLLQNAALLWRIVAGILFGLAIGLVSSLLGEACGELIIPTLVFAFGADIKTWFSCS